MQLPPDIRPDERLLVLGFPDAELLTRLARSVPQGLLVVMGEHDAVRETRRLAAHLDNVMCVPGTPDEIPWRDGFFSRALDLVRNWPDAARVESEIRRVTTGGPQSSEEG